MNGNVVGQVETDTTETVLKSLGYADPMDAARQQARMILLGRLAHYRSAVQQIERKWNQPLAELRQQYEGIGQENMDLDDDYVAWQWYIDAIAKLEAQLTVITNPESSSARL
jgi:hypothetical protein